MTGYPKRGEVFVAKLGEGEGSEQTGTRPVVIVSNDLFNEAMPMVTILPVTSVKPGRRLRPSEAAIGKVGGLRTDSKVACHQIRTIARSRLGKHIGTLDPETFGAVSDGLRLHLQL